MRLLTALGFHSWSDFLACLSSYALLAYLFWLLLWPQAWS